MNEKRIRLLFSFFLALAAAFLVFSWRSPLSRDLSSGKPFEIAVLDAEKPFLVRYDASTRTFKVFKPGKRLKLKGTSFQKAYNLISQVYKAGADREKIYFVDVSSAAFGDAEQLVSFLNSWRKRPAAITDFVRRLAALKGGQLTNLQVIDVINLSVEMLHINTSNFIIEEIDIKNPDLEEEPDRPVSPAGETGRNIKVEIFNASAKNNLALKMTEHLRSSGVNVLNSATMERRKKTEIISRSENVEKAKVIREILDLKNLEIYVKKSKYKVFDVTIIIGEDFDERKVSE